MEEKPYLQRFGNGAPTKTNMSLETRERIPIENMRLLPNLSLDVQGFDIVPYKPTLTYEEYWDENAVKQKHLPEIAEVLKKQYGATRVDFVRHKVSRLLATSSTLQCE